MEYDGFLMKEKTTSNNAQLTRRIRYYSVPVCFVLIAAIVRKIGGH